MSNMQEFQQNWLYLHLSLETYIPTLYFSVWLLFSSTRFKQTQIFIRYPMHRYCHAKGQQLFHNYPLGAASTYWVRASTLRVHVYTQGVYTCYNSNPLQPSFELVESFGPLFKFRHFFGIPFADWFVIVIPLLLEFRFRQRHKNLHV